ncbi:MAG: hypothetical protein O2U61_00705, partial [Candidatus Bathyarchaeota archaeon]|nr:hypothetical protein [Candidatus Bathyarchaeota archaeon]
MKINKQSFVNHFYIFLLLAFSGNPFFNPGDGISQYFFIGLVLILLLIHYSYLNPQKSLYYYKFILFFTSIFGCQYIFLGDISLPGAVGFLLKITLGYIIIRHVGEKFVVTYFNVIFFISIISLAGYLWNLLGYNIPFL